MTTTDTNVQNLIINKLTKQQYESILSPSDTELYLTPDESLTADDLKTINGTSIVGSGDITVTVSTDNTTINENSSNALQAIGVIDDRSGNALKTWTGTKVQYDAIVTKDANTLYNIIDDTDVTLSLLELLYPVGSIYIGTMQTCPLQSLGVGTWQLVASDRVLQGAGTGGSAGSTKEAGLPNITGTHFKATGAPSSWVDLGCFSGSTYLNDFGYSGGSEGKWDIKFDASRSNAIYGNSNTVQPPAYVVNVWERVS